MAPPIALASSIMLEQSVASCGGVLLQLLERPLAGDDGKGKRFYVGTCLDPLRRWHGDSKDDLAAWRSKNPRKRMRPLEKGHKANGYTCMWLLALADHRTAALLEPYLIDLAKVRCGYDAMIDCDNIVSDARGMAAGMNWLYLVVGEQRRVDTVAAARRRSQHHLAFTA